MKKETISAAIHSRPLVVGTLHSSACLQRLAYDSSSELLKKCDFLEARLDVLAERELSEWWPCPMIATARHPAEGGEKNLTSSERRGRLEKALSWASAIDVELRSFAELAEVRARARGYACPVIASFHDIEGVPSTAALEKMAHQAEAEGAGFLKIAVTPRTEEELEQLLDFQKNFSSQNLRLAVMGMGSLGAVSRQRLLKAGAALVYGWLYHPHVIGQPSIEELLCSEALAARTGVEPVRQP